MSPAALSLMPATAATSAPAVLAAPGVAAAGPAFQAAMTAALGPSAPAATLALRGNQPARADVALGAVEMPFAAGSAGPLLSTLISAISAPARAATPDPAEVASASAPTSPLLSNLVPTNSAPAGAAAPRPAPAAALTHATHPALPGGTAVAEAEIPSEDLDGDTPPSATAAVTLAGEPATVQEPTTPSPTAPADDRLTQSSAASAKKAAAKPEAASDPALPAAPAGPALRVRAAARANRSPPAIAIAATSADADAAAAAQDEPTDAPVSTSTQFVAASQVGPSPIQPLATPSTPLTVSAPASEPNATLAALGSDPGAPAPANDRASATSQPTDTRALADALRADGPPVAATQMQHVAVQQAPQSSAPAVTPGTPAATPLAQATVDAQPGRFGHQMGLEIARTVEASGEQLTVRLNPAEMGRIEVKLSFDDRGTVRAVVAAENPAALDVLRRDSVDLNRALADAGIRSDAQSFRFDSRAGSGGEGGQFWQRQQQASQQNGRNHSTASPAGEDPVYRPLRTSGQVDLMA